MKVAIRWAAGERLANCAAAARLATSHGIRTPQVLAIGTPRPEFGGRAYSVWDYLEGQDAADALTSMADTSRHAFFSALGGVVAALHAISAERYTGSVLDTDAQPNWARAVRDRLGRIPERYRAVGLDMDAGVAQALERIAALAEEVSGLSRPALVHTDLYLDNLLVGADGEPVLLDFEHARYGDAATDFVKPALFIGPVHAGAQQTMLDGYQQHADERGLLQRINLALGLELVWGIPFFHQWNDDHVEALYRSSLTEWVDARGAGLT